MAVVMSEFVWVGAAEVVIHSEQGVRRADNGCGGRGEMPFKLVEPGDEGIGEEEVVVEELTIGATSAVWNTPAESLLRAGEDLRDAMGVLEMDFVDVNVVTEAAGLNDGDEAPTQLGLFLLREFHRDNPAGKGTVEQGPKAFANTGGVDDDMLRMPGRGEGLELAKNGKVVFANPTVARQDMVGGVAKGGEGGEVDGDDGEGGGVTAGIGEARGRGCGEVEAGFIDASNVEE
ncbi:MAG TPA: hypothetical protein VMT91_02525, partial [Anaerolineales bacterium]|nr:hypothetical protein [Anaerolineales bacterium]